MWVLTYIQFKLFKRVKHDMVKNTKIKKSYTTNRPFLSQEVSRRFTCYRYSAYIYYNISWFTKQ